MLCSREQLKIAFTQSNEEEFQVSPHQKERIEYFVRELRQCTGLTPLELLSATVSASYQLIFQLVS